MLVRFSRLFAKTVTNFLAVLAAKVKNGRISLEHNLAQGLKNLDNLDLERSGNFDEGSYNYKDLRRGHNPPKLIGKALRRCSESQGTKTSKHNYPPEN